MAITREQIWAAADEIEAAGERPTLAAIRTRIGGSFSTIGPALNEWKQRRIERSRPSTDPTPAPVIEQAATLAHGIWSAAIEIANARLASERETLEQMRTDAAEQLAEAVEAADRYAALLDETQGRLDAALKRADALNAELIEARARLEQMRAVQKQAADDRETAAAAREKAAHLAGQVESLKQQVVGLLDKLGGKPGRETTKARQG